MKGAHHLVHNLMQSGVSSWCFKTEKRSTPSLRANNTHITVLPLLEPHTLNKYVPNPEILTTLHAVVLELNFIPFLPVSLQTLLCPNKGCKQHSQRPDWTLHFPILPTVLCSALFHCRRTVSSDTGVSRPWALCIWQPQWAPITLLSRIVWCHLPSVDWMWWFCACSVKG